MSQDDFNERIKVSKVTPSKARTDTEKQSDKANLNASDSLAKQAAEIEKGSRSNLIESLLNQEVQKKRTCSYYMNERIDKLLKEIGVSRGQSKSQVVNEIILGLVADEEIVKGLFDSRQQITKLLQEYRK